jgi:hypothetical protein
MDDSKKLFRAIRNGHREFRREDFADSAEFKSIVEEMDQANKLGFLKGYKVYRAKSPSNEVIKVSASHGLSDEGMDYLIRIGG